MKKFIEKLNDRLEHLLNNFGEHCEEWGSNQEGECNRKSCSDCVIRHAIEIVNQLAEEYGDGWIPCEKELPPQPEENPVFDNRSVELYLVSEENADYPFRAFWNGKHFTDGFGVVDVAAWQPLPQTYKPEGE